MDVWRRRLSLLSGFITVRDPTPSSRQDKNIYWPCRLASEGRGLRALVVFRHAGFVTRDPKCTCDVHLGSHQGAERPERPEQDSDQLDPTTTDTVLSLSMTKVCPLLSPQVRPIPGLGLSPVDPTKECMESNAWRAPRSLAGVRMQGFAMLLD